MFRHLNGRGIIIVVNSLSAQNPVDACKSDAAIHAIRERVEIDSGFDRLFYGHGKFRLLPGVEASANIDNVLKTSALEQAAGDHASIPSLAMHGDVKIAVDFRWRDFEIVQRPPRCAFNVSGFPLGLA